MVISLMILAVWSARIAFISFTLAAYVCQRRLEKERKQVERFKEVYNSAPDEAKETWEWRMERKERKASRLRNRRDLLLGLALSLFLADLWLLG